MKKLIFPILVIMMFISTIALADKTLNKQHINLKTRDGAKVNCILCHQTAGIPKKKGAPYKHLYTNRLCDGPGCHPLPKEK
jgi:hypothetical protein